MFAHSFARLATPSHFLFTCLPQAFACWRFLLVTELLSGGVRGHGQPWFAEKTQFLATEHRRSLQHLFFLSLSLRLP